MSETVIDTSNPGKISTIFLQFITPMMREVLDPNALPSGEEMERLFHIPWMAWNAEVCRANDSSMDIITSFKLQMKDNPQAVTLFDEYRERKRTEFKLHNIMLGKVVFTPKIDGQFTVKVEARKPPQKNEVPS